MKFNLTEVWIKNRAYLLFTFLLTIPLTFTPYIIARIAEVLVSWLFLWILSFIYLKRIIKKEESERIFEILRIRYEDKTFLPTIVLLFVFLLICLIPLSLFFNNIFLHELLLNTPLESINTIYLIYLLLILSFPVVLYIFSGISIFLTDFPIKMFIKLSKSDLSVFEWLFLRKITNKKIYQNKDFVVQHNFFTIVRTSFYYIIQVTSALYTLYYGFIIALRVEINSSTIEIIMGILALVIFVNTLFWNYYKRELFISELGLVTQDPDSRLIKKLDSSLFEKSLKSYFSAALIFSIFSTLPQIPQVLYNLSDYYDLLLGFSIFPAFFILQSILFFIELKFNDSNKELKNDLLSKNQIENCDIKVQITPITNNVGF